MRLHEPTAAAMVMPSAETLVAPTGLRDRLAWQVARRLSASIMRDGWPIGTRLGTEPRLMKALGVSREPFREGVRLLELQGIVRMTRGPSGGLFVTAPALEVVSGLVRGYLELSEITFREVIDARRAIERHAVGLAIERLTPRGGHDLALALDAARASMYDRLRRRSVFFDVLRALERIAADPCLSIFDEALQAITIDFGLHERLPGELWPEYSERGYRALEQLVDSVSSGDVERGQAAIDALLSRIDDYVQRVDDARLGLWTTRSFITGAYLSAGKLLSGADKSGLKLAYRITAEVRRQSLPVGTTIGAEAELIARYGVSRAVFREAARMLEFFGVVEVRRGKEGGLTVAGMDASGTVDSALLYLSYAGIRPAQTRELLDQVRTAGAAAAEARGSRNRALELFERVLRARN